MTFAISVTDSTGTVVFSQTLSKLELYEYLSKFEAFLSSGNTITIKQGN